MGEIKDIIKNKNLKEIHINEFKNDSILPRDEDKVLDLIEKLKGDYTKFLALISFICIVINFALFFSIDNSSYPMIYKSICIALFETVFIFLINYYLKKIKNLKNIYSAKKSQYGKVLSKYYLDTQVDRFYYVDVAFEGDSSYICNVNCDKNEYYLLDKDMEVLVITFDDIDAYCIMTD